MFGHQLDVPAGWGIDEVSAAIASLGTDPTLVIGAPRTLRTVPGSAHWHLHGTKGTGTVELTYDPARRRLDIFVHDNRHGTWAGEALKEITGKLKGMIAPG